MVVFTLDNEREQKINTLFLPIDRWASCIGAYVYYEDEETLYFFGETTRLWDKEKHRWVVVKHTKDFNEDSLVKKIEITF